MIQSKVTTGIYLDPRRKMKDGIYPVKLRVTYERESKFYNLPGYSYSKDDFKKIVGDKPRDNFKDIKTKLLAIEADAISVIKSLPVFTFDKFEKKFKNKAGRNGDFFEDIQHHLETIKANGQISTAHIYRALYNSVNTFSRKEKLPYKDITVKFLKDFEKHLLLDEKSVTTVSIYCRGIQHLYNRAIKAGDAFRESYPFGMETADLYQIPETNNIKKALPKSEVMKLINCKCEDGSPEQFYRDLWAFSYLCNGMNVADIVRLKYKNVRDEEIIYKRQKVVHNRKIRPIVATVTDQVKAIIDKWGTKPVTSEKFIFGILTDGLTAPQIYAKIHQATKQTNKYIKQVAEKAKISGSVTTYTARHSFASVLKISGEDIAYISEALGHTDLRTTEAYLSSFDKTKRKQAAKNLTD